jgi:peptide/nickel transport system substrate-binding protein
MTRSRITAAIAALTATAALAAGCGSDSSSDSGSSGGGGTATKTGGTLIANYNSFPDFLDPALSYTADGWDVLWSAYTPLLTYKHAAGAAGSEVVPGLAEALPTVSADGLTYTVKLRSGLMYSDGSAVKASDFEHAIKRVLILESGGSSFYTGIEGAAKYQKAGKNSGDITGITADDASGEITIKLVKKDPQFNFKLAMDFSGLVPSDTPFTNETKNPPPGAGPYMFTKVVTGQKWTLQRNPHFKALPNVPDAKADEIDFTVVKNQRRSATDVVNNKVDYIYDASGPDVLSILRQGAKDRYQENPTNNTYYEFLDQTQAPFNNLKARQAINIAVDKTAIARLYAGLLEPDCNFLPPGMIGYEKLDPCPFGDPTTSKGDIAKAKQLVQESGTAGQSVTVWGDTEDPSGAVTDYYADILNQIGYKAKSKVIDASDYFATIGNHTTKAQIGFTDWFQDFPHPSNFLFLVDSRSIQPTNNQNFGNIGDKKLDSMIDAANASEDPKAVADQYGAIDKYLADNAYVAVYGHRKLAAAFSDRIAVDQAIFHPVYDFDPTTFALKAGE